MFHQPFAFLPLLLKKGDRNHRTAGDYQKSRPLRLSLSLSLSFSIGSWKGSDQSCRWKVHLYDLSAAAARDTVRARYASRTCYGNPLRGRRHF